MAIADSMIQAFATMMARQQHRTIDSMGNLQMESSGVREGWSAV